MHAMVAALVPQFGVVPIADPVRAEVRARPDVRPSDQLVEICLLWSLLDLDAH